MKNRKILCKDEFENDINSIFVNFELIDSMFNCLNALLSEEMTYRAGEAANVLEVTKRLIKDTRKKFDKIERRLNL